VSRTSQNTLNASWIKYGTDLASCGCAATGTTCTTAVDKVCGGPGGQGSATCDVLANAWECPAPYDTVCLISKQPYCPNGSSYCDDISGWSCPEGCQGGAVCSNDAPPACENGVWTCYGATACDGGMVQCPPGESPYCGNGGWACGNPQGTPIVIDTNGEGFHLTNSSNGVQFKFFPSSPPVQISWTDAAFSNGWLALDRNGNGIIDNGTELFGNLTPQPPSPDPNGYLALAVFDDPKNGGNGNGVIDPGDSIYPYLRIWIDANHNGVSEHSELHPLQELGVFKIDLQYALSSYVDSNGNQFRYRAKIWDESGREHNICYDVFLTYTRISGGKGTNPL
jgi:hypothetical protein